MKPHALSTLLVLLSLNIISCKNAEEASQSNLEVVLSVYDPSNPGTVRSSGDFDPSELKVFFDGEYLGMTPLEFTTERLRTLGMPSYEKVDTSENSFWLTWDSDGHGRFELTMPDDPASRRILEFRSAEDDSVVLFAGVTTQPVGDGAIQLSVTIPNQSNG